MILIKDRHHSGSLILKKVPCEKYDTYKGSTLVITHSFTLNLQEGNMILIKDRHNLNKYGIAVVNKIIPGKYDTYKGSTLFSVI